MKNIPNILDYLDDTLDTSRVGSLFSQGTLCLYYECNDYYEIAIDKVFSIIRSGDRVSLSDFKKMA